MKRVLAVWLVMPLPLLGLMGLAIQLGTMLPLPTVLTNLQTCEVPCWNHITPGITSMEEAHNRLVESGYRVRRSPSFRSGETIFVAAVEPCQIWVSQRDNIVNDIWLRYCDAIWLGNVMSIFGIPEGLAFRPWGDTYLLYRETLVTVQVPAWSSAFEPVFSLLLWSREDRPPEEVSAWNGFVPLWRYCQLQPAAEVPCSIVT